MTVAAPAHQGVEAKEVNGADREFTERHLAAAAAAVSPAAANAYSPTAQRAKPAAAAIAGGRAQGGCSSMCMVHSSLDNIASSCQYKSLSQLATFGC